MTQGEMQKVVADYVDSSQISSEIEMIQKLILCFFDLVLNHHTDPVTKAYEGDSKLLLQMVMTKLAHLKAVLEGINVQKADGQDGLNNDIVDPIVVATLVRNIYETVCVFMLINSLATTEEEKKIVHNIWVISGLKYRQRFANVATKPESIQKLADEKVEIEALTKEIKDTALYKSLPDREKSKIDHAIKSKDFKISIDSAAKKVRKLTWQDISNTFVTQSRIFDDMYTYFSLYAHPSNVSVFQYGTLFDPQNNAFLSKAKFMASYAVALGSIFLAVYLEMFPNALETFEKHTTIDQIMLNFYNRLLRGEDASINDAWRELG